MFACMRPWIPPKANERYLRMGKKIIAQKANIQDGVHKIQGGKTIRIGRRTEQIHRQRQRTGGQQAHEKIVSLIQENANQTTAGSSHACKNGSFKKKISSVFLISLVGIIN